MCQIIDIRAREILDSRGNPTITDYSTIFPATRTFSNFPNTPATYTYSSTTDLTNMNNAFSVNYADGGIASIWKTQNYQVRCVRKAY